MAAKMWWSGLKLLVFLVLFCVTSSSSFRDSYDSNNYKFQHLKAHPSNPRHRHEVNNYKLHPYHHNVHRHSQHFMNYPRTTENPHKLRHGRFSKLDDFMDKIHNYDALETTTTSHRWNQREAKARRVFPLRRHSGLKSFDHFREENPVSEETGLEDYDEESDNENENGGGSYNDYEESDTADEDDDELGDNFRDDDENDDENDKGDKGWQAEEPTTEISTSSQLSPFTENKWSHYGTRESVTRTRQKWLQNHSQGSEQRQRKIVHEALEHARRMSSVEGACRVPRPRVVSIQSLHPDPAVTYIPHCTLLHRCGDDAGCCAVDTDTCVPKSQQIVHLYFYISYLGQANSVKRLAFENHTECECMDRKEWKQRIDAGIGVRNISAFEVNETETTSAISRRDIPQARHPFVQAESEAVKRCKCPSLYVSKIHNGQCKCDCEIHNIGCIYMKRGKEYFSYADRACIQYSQCKEPACEFGSYLLKQGRCPKKNEKFAEMSKLRRNYH